MDIMGSLFAAVVRIINLGITLYIYIVIASALISWVNPDPYNPIVRFLRNATDPLLDRIRRALPVQMGGFDLSPIVLIFGLYLVSALLNSLAIGMTRGF
ncbi:MAG: YggT family protein [Geoalkalibacter sp.]|jgi:YggT family protein|uniref:YggT family protein n=1 Tax=Geoalkalibacter sp. TaxID=3041440 RepID=UPI002A9375D9|nr:YggT family protein [Thermodesulfobacteriota bacterium]